jgi:ABC-type antimicrobial peptide transport system permease subunit
MWQHCRASGLVALIALPAGTVLSLGIAPSFGDLTYHVGSRDPWSLTLAVGIAAVAGALGTYIPVRRARHVNLLNALRET